VEFQCVLSGWQVWALTVCLLTASRIAPLETRIPCGHMWICEKGLRSRGIIRRLLRRAGRLMIIFRCMCLTRVAPLVGAHTYTPVGYTWINECERG
jgi:hypothetical protein